VDGVVLLQRRQRLPLPGLHHQPAGRPDRAARTAAPPPRRRRRPDPLRQGHRPRQSPLPRLPAERRLARARPHRPGSARLGATAAAQRRARPLRTETPPLPAAARRRPAHPPRPPPAPAPAARLGLGRGALSSIRTPPRAPAAAVSRRRSLPPLPNDDRPASACPRTPSLARPASTRPSKARSREPATTRRPNNAPESRPHSGCCTIRARQPTIGHGPRARVRARGRTLLRRAAPGERAPADRSLSRGRPSGVTRRLGAARSSA
jgi:hypothetical protein